MLKAAGLTLALCALTASAARLAQATGYLTVLGPAPLRFQPAPSPRAPLPLPLAPLAQLIQRESPPAAVTNTPALSPVESAPFLPEMPGAAELGMPPEPWLDLPPVLSRNQAAPDPGLNPQAFLGYLAPVPTNGMTAPYQAPAFVPPVVIELPSSKATYQSR